MKKMFLFFILACSANAQTYPVPSNSVSLLYGVDAAQTVIFVPTTTPVPSGAYGASIISGNVPYNKGLDNYIEPVWVSSGNNNSVTVQRGTIATANAQGTWTIQSQNKGLIIGHTIRTLPRLLYYAGTPTNTFTPTITFTPTNTFTPTKTPYQVGPMAVVTPGASPQVVSDLNIPGNLSVGGVVSGWLSASNVSTSNVVDATGNGIIGSGSNVVTVGNSQEALSVPGTSVSFGLQTINGVPTPSTATSATNKTYVDALSGSGQPTPAPRRIGDVYVNSAGTTVYIGVSLTPVTGWLQVKP